jgi:hypothetical protein
MVSTRSDGGPEAQPRPSAGGSLICQRSSIVRHRRRRRPRAGLPVP